MDPFRKKRSKNRKETQILEELFLSPTTHRANNKTYQKTICAAMIETRGTTHAFTKEMTKVRLN